MTNYKLVRIRPVTRRSKTEGGGDSKIFGTLGGFFSKSVLSEDFQRVTSKKRFKAFGYLRKIITISPKILVYGVFYGFYWRVVGKILGF